MGPYLLTFLKAKGSGQDSHLEPTAVLNQVQRASVLYWPAGLSSDLSNYCPNPVAIHQVGKIQEHSIAIRQGCADLGVPWLSGLRCHLYHKSRDLPHLSLHIISS